MYGVFFIKKIVISTITILLFNFKCVRYCVLGLFIFPLSTSCFHSYFFITSAPVIIFSVAREASNEYLRLLVILLSKTSYMIKICSIIVAVSGDHVTVSILISQYFEQLFVSQIS